MSLPNAGVEPERASTFLTPASFIEAARKAHPAFRYAIVAAGILAIVVVFAKYGTSYATLIFGAIALIGLMAVFVVFAQVARLGQAQLTAPAKVLVWSFLVLAIFIAVMLVFSAFFDQPLPFKSWIIRQLALDMGGGLPPPPGVSSPDSRYGDGVYKERQRGGAYHTDLVAPVAPDVDADRLLRELVEAYKAVAWQSAAMDNWSSRSAQDVKIDGSDLMLVVPGKTVRMSIDPVRLPPLNYYHSVSSQLSGLGGNRAALLDGFSDAFEGFRVDAKLLIEHPGQFGGNFIETRAAAKKAVLAGRSALCALGQNPPKLYDGSVPEPFPLDCSSSVQ